MTSPFRLCRALILGLPLLAALPAHAQYSWMDEHGTRVFSDQPPPPGTPAKRILKAPRGLAPAASTEQDAPASGGDAAAKPAAPKGPPTLADREADYAKRTKQREADEAKATAAREKEAATAQHCAGLRQNEAQLNSGIRMMRVNAAGEREYIGDDERTRMIDQARREAAACH